MVVPYSNDQSPRHFLLNMKWDERRIVDMFAKNSDQALRDRQSTCVIIVETCFPKKRNNRPFRKAKPMGCELLQRAKVSVMD